MRDNVIKVGLCGFGAVGNGVYKYLECKSDALCERIGARIEVARIAVRDTSKRRSFTFADGVLTDDSMSIATDPSIDVLCELIGGTTVAKDVSIAALESGKTLVTANKALLCDHGPELFAAAKKGGSQILFEASVAGGIPLIKAIREGLVVNSFQSIYGIVSGTCNYMLTHMTAKGGSYEDVLAEAKALDYAEADESFDVEGIDTAHKAVVLAYLAHGKWIPYEDVLVRGIDKVTQDDIRYAKENGYAIKLLAAIDVVRVPGKLYISVLPTLIPQKHVLGGVDSVFNAISVCGDIVGETVYIGPGAGGDATASAVIADIVDAAKGIVSGSNKGLSADAALREGFAIELARSEDVSSRYYLRLRALGKPDITAILAERGIDVESVARQEPEGGESQAALIVLTTGMTTEGAILDTVKALSESSLAEGEPFFMPINSFGE